MQTTPGIRLTKRGRHLTDDQDIFSQNAWDDFVWNDDMIQEAEQRLKIQCEEANVINEGNAKERISKIESECEQRWEEFYATHEDRFFKDRRWIFSELPEILEYLKLHSKDCKLLEVGSGVGNAVIPIVKENKNPRLSLYCCDISSHAIDTLKKNPLYSSSANIFAFQLDITNSLHQLEEKIPGELNFITMIFVLSAIRVDQMSNVVSNLVKYLAKGGMIFFRDYARYDMAQLRFKGKSRLAENYYVRGDGTTTYFFTENYIDSLFTAAGMKKLELSTDRRLLCNRAKSLKMCRCWIQAKYIKE